MAVKIAPIPLQYFDDNGDPLAGGLLNFYAAGSTTRLTTYTDSTGGVAQPNPVVLDSAGRIPTGGVWLTDGRAYKVIITNSVGAAVGVPLDNLRGVNDTTTTVDEWVSPGFAPTYISATSFSVPGDQTTILKARRRIKATTTGGTRYGTIYSSSYGAGITTVVIVLDSGSLDSGLSAIAYGLLSADNSALPTDATYGPYWDPTNFEFRIGNNYSTYNQDGEGDGRVVVRALNTHDKLRLGTWDNTGGAAGSNYHSWIALDCARGPLGTPTGLLAGDIIGTFVGVGYGTSFGHGGMVEIVATENWDGTHHGSGVRLYTVPNGSTVQRVALTLGQDASVEATNGQFVGQSGATLGYGLKNNTGSAVTTRMHNDANDATVHRPGKSGGDVFVNNFANSQTNMSVSDAGVVKFPNIGTTASAANAYIDNGASNSILRSTSSARYKRDIADVTREEVDAAMALRAITYASLAPADDPGRRWFGFTAEDADAKQPMLVTYGIDELGAVRPDGFQYERLTVIHHAELKRLWEEFEAYREAHP